MISSLRLLFMSLLLGVVFAPLSSALAGAPNLKRWKGAELSKMLQESDRAPVLNADLLRRLNTIHTSKCARLHENQPCFLSELDAGLGPYSDRYLLFRGEPDGYDQPMTSALVRGALADGHLCEPACDPKQLSAALHRLVETLIPKVAKVNPKFYGGHTFDVVTQAWQFDSQPMNALFDDKKKPAASELLINAHFRGHLQTLKMKNTYSDEAVLDPFVSFSSSPEIALKFSNSHAGRGRIWLVSVAAKDLKTIKGGSCKRPLTEVGYYDLSNCSRPRIYKGEREFDAFMHAPSNSILGYFRR